VEQTLGSLKLVALANEFKNIKCRLAQGFEKRGSVSRLAQTCPFLLTQSYVDRCVAKQPGTSFEFTDFPIMREGAKRRCPTMAKERLGYEPYAWWLTREQLGLCLRKDYRVPQELPPRLLALVRKLETADATEDSQRA
jgi:hypothetical protein